MPLCLPRAQIICSALVAALVVSARDPDAIRPLIDFMYGLICMLMCPVGFRAGIMGAMNDAGPENWSAAADSQVGTPTWPGPDRPRTAWDYLLATAGRATATADAWRTSGFPARRAIARRWRLRSHVPSRYTPVGSFTGRESMSALLAGLRLGSARLEGNVDTAIGGTTARLKVEHDELLDNRLTCHMRGWYDQSWLPGSGELRHIDVAGTVGVLPVLVDGMTWIGWGTDDDLEPFGRGPCRAVVVGAESKRAALDERSATWHAWLIGLPHGDSPARFKLGDADVTLTSCDEDPAMESARWRHSPGGHDPAHQMTLQPEQPVLSWKH
jgi:hypothetical protein